jgi:hypothetical protein
MGNTTTRAATPTAPDSLNQAENEDQRLAELEANNAALEQEVIERQRQLDAQANEIERLRAESAAREASMSALEREAEVSEAAKTAAPAKPAKPAEQGGNFTTEDAYRSWRVRARNGSFTGETEGFAFANGQVLIPGLPRTASPQRVAVRVLRLNNLRNYPVFEREANPRTRRLETKRYEGYQVLTPEQYEALYPQDDTDGDEIPEDL